MLQNIFANYSSRLTVVLLHTIHVPPIADRDQRGIRGPGAVLPEGAGLPHGEVQHLRRRRGARTPAGRVRSQDLRPHVGCCLITCLTTRLLSRVLYSVSCHVSYIACLITCIIPCLLADDVSTQGPQAAEDGAEVRHRVSLHRRRPGHRHPLREDVMPPTMTPTLATNS